MRPEPDDAGIDAGTDDAAARAVARLEGYHTRRHRGLTLVLPLALGAFALWAGTFRVDEVARGAGEVVASSRVQVIQAVDGGVIASIEVEEGERVVPGQTLATLERGRTGAAAAEIEARLRAARLRAARLRAEAIGGARPAFDAVGPDDAGRAELEAALFEQRARGLAAELRTLGASVALARRELALVRSLEAGGDVGTVETIAAERALVEAEAGLVNRRNAFLEDARRELAEVEDEIAESEQVLAARLEALEASAFVARVPGIVKDIRVATLGGVLGPGEELMQIVPVGDALLVEAKVAPADIARVRPGLAATVRLDPFDHTVFGGVTGEVVYVGADTLKVAGPGGAEEVFYRVRVAPTRSPAVTTTGRTLALQPGMTAQVDIRTGERTLAAYLLKPLRKTLADSFGER